MQLNPDFSDLQPYIANGPYASALKTCVSIVNESDSCSLNTLPPIGLNNTIPTIDDILNHVVVSHPWMGDRMRDLLEQMPADMLLLLRANTAIVIDADIRPAYFWSATGAIYIDPAFLWTTNEEKATIDQTEDFRSSFGNELLFKPLWRYIIDDFYAWTSYSLTGDEVRTTADTLVLTTWLFYHELAHANDCLPPAELANLTAGDSYYTNFVTINNRGGCIHDQLTAMEPLTSTVWSSLGSVLYRGADATTQQKTMSSEFVGTEFSNDVASDTYSYSSIWEDTAMLFEEVMMKRTFNADRDIIIVDAYEEFSCAQVLVRWGQRGRLGNPLVIERAQFIMAQLLPELDMDEFFANQPTPTQSTVGISYCLNTPTAQSQLTGSGKVKFDELQILNQLEIE